MNTIVRHRWLKEKEKNPLRSSKCSELTSSGKWAKKSSVKKKHPSEQSGAKHSLEGGVAFKSFCSRFSASATPQEAVAAVCLPKESRKCAASTPLSAPRLCLSRPFPCSRAGKPRRASSPAGDGCWASSASLQRAERHQTLFSS